MSLPIGIDLGTTTSEIAVFRNDKPEFLRDIHNSRNGILPSAVAEGPHGELRIGNLAWRDPDGVKEVKRHMGTDKTFQMAGESYRPEEISARILRHLKENAERILGEEITEAVITVPADFKDRQRHATIRAGEIAGLKVERIINEPTAAALAYGLERLDEDHHVIVYDFGGGTFDVSVLEMFQGVFEVKASAGDDKLGGLNFDRRIVGLIERELQRQSDIKLERAGAGADRKAFEEVKHAAEKAKIELSSQDATVIEFPYLAAKDVDFQMVLSRREFEAETRDLVDRTGEKIDLALSDAGVKKEDVDEVLLVGGTTRMPAVREFVSSYFGGRSLPERIPPDEAVALGAAVQAALKDGTIDPQKGMIVTDVTSHSLGVASVGYESGMLMKDRMSVHIPRQTTIPVEKSDRYATVSDEQESVLIRVYQGESKDVEENELLDAFQLSGFPPAPAGEEELEISFKLDQNARLDVTATILSTGESATKRVEHTAARMTDAERKAAQEDLDQQWNESKFLERVRPILETAERKRDQAEGQQAAELDRIVSELKQALAEEDEEAVDRLDRELTDLLFEME